MFVAPTPSIPEIVEKLGPEALGKVIAAQADFPPDDDYVHWDKLRQPLTSPDGLPFSYSLPDAVLRHLHRVDQRCGGEVAMDEVVTSQREAGQRFLVNSLMEEAIRSSQLEGATTSRKVAKEMLRTGRRPRNRSEQMIANNYRARLCAFANEGEDGERFIHPVARAILLHFWLAYDHPFEDGNGRTARILFFWAMQKRGYWLIEHLPISPILRKAPALYTRAFMETETDGGDTTFLIHQLKTIERALSEHDAYLQRKIAEVRGLERLLQDADGLNHRQLALLTDAVRHSDSVYSFDSHATSHRVTHETARADLGGLARRDLLIRRRRGRKHVFEPAPDLPERLRESTR